MSEDIRLFADHGCKVVHNPESNMKLASGVAPISAMLQQGIIVGLGTDGCASNNNLDMFQEMDTAAKLEKSARLDPTVMSARTVLRMATCNGAKVLGLDRLVGTLEAGKKGGHLHHRYEQTASDTAVRRILPPGLRRRWRGRGYCPDQWEGGHEESPASHDRRGGGDAASSRDRSTRAEKPRHLIGPTG